MFLVNCVCKLMYFVVCVANLDQDPLVNEIFHPWLNKGLISKQQPDLTDGKICCYFSSMIGRLTCQSEARASVGGS